LGLIDQPVVKGWQKPQQLIDAIIKRHMTRVNGNILDAMCGTATTSVCALRAGMNAVAFDKDKFTSIAALARVATLTTDKFIGPVQEVYTKPDWKALAPHLPPATLVTDTAAAVDLTQGEAIQTGQADMASEAVEEDEVLVYDLAKATADEDTVEGNVEADDVGAEPENAEPDGEEVNPQEPDAVDPDETQAPESEDVIPETEFPEAAALTVVRPEAAALTEARKEQDDAVAASIQRTTGNPETPQKRTSVRLNKWGK